MQVGMWDDKTFAHFLLNQKQRKWGNGEELLTSVS